VGFEGYEVAAEHEYRVKGLGFGVQGETAKWEVIVGEGLAVWRAFLCRHREPQLLRRPERLRNQNPRTIHSPSTRARAE
jgi:hypothetical protein